MIASFLPATGSIKKITIYYSNYGQEMNEYLIKNGPPIFKNTTKRSMLIKKKERKHKRKGRNEKVIVVVIVKFFSFTNFSF